MDESRGRFYLPQLDGLRFWAFMLVFVHHSPVFPGGSRVGVSVKDLGWIGVDLFFVLSAYLLIALLHREHAVTGATDFKKFYVRRVLRIWPLFYLYVSGCFLYFLAFDREDVVGVMRRTIGHLLFVDNVLTAFSGRYNPLSFTPHLWTIAFEEQIYLLIPLLFAAILWLRRHNTLFALTSVVILATQPLVRWGVTWFTDGERAIFVLPVLHFDTIFAGLLLGAGVGARLKDRISGDLLAAGGAVVLVVIVFVLPYSDYSGSLPDRRIYLFSVLAFAFFFIVLGCLDERSWTAWLLSRQPFVFLGRISYGLYVWHWVGNEFGPGVARSWFPAYASPDTAVATWLWVVLPALALTVALAVLSHFAIERPFLRIKNRFTVVANRKD